MQQPPTPPEAAVEIDFVKGLVARHFPVYDVRVNYDAVQFFCRIDEATLDKNFEAMREEMKGHGYIPMITYEKGEHIVLVAKKPPVKYRSTWVNLAMLCFTFLTVTYAGVLHWTSYAEVPIEETWTWENFGMGILVFTMPLMAILGVHEFGHYFAARRRKVAASLPFFVPLVPPFGTFGAFISMRDPIPDKKSLLEIGVAGPLAGLVVAIALCLVGLHLTNEGAEPVPENYSAGDLLYLQLPFIYQWLAEVVPVEGDYLIHPTALAAWAGFLVTALNLLPAGQLDGGHIARALLGARAKYASWAAIAILLVLSLYYAGWIFLAILILVFGIRHPPPLNDLSKLDLKHKLLGVGAFVVLIIAFAYQPMVPVVPDYSFEATAIGSTNETIEPGGTAYFQVAVSNLGDMKNNISITMLSSPFGWNASFKRSDSADSDYNSTLRMRLDIEENATVDVRIIAYADADEGNASVSIRAYSEATEDDDTADQRILYNFTVTYPSLVLWVMEPQLAIAPGTDATSTVQVNSTRPFPSDVTLKLGTMPAYVGAVLYLNDPGEEGAGSELSITVPADGNITFNIQVFVWSGAQSGSGTLEVGIYVGEALVDTVHVTVSVT